MKLRVGLQQDEVEVEKYREGSDEHHEEGACPGFNSVAFHAGDYSRVLENSKSDQKNRAVHRPLAFRVRQGVQLE